MKGSTNGVKILFYTLYALFPVIFGQNPRPGKDLKIQWGRSQVIHDVLTPQISALFPCRVRAAKEYWETIGADVIEQVNSKLFRLK